MIIEILAGLVVLVVLWYIYMRKKWTFWSSRGVYQPETYFPVGSFPELFTRKKHFSDILLQHGEEARGKPFYGVYVFRTPTLVIQDPNLIKAIFVKDFDAFVNRNAPDIGRKLMQTGTRTDKIWTLQMASAYDEEWKDLRSTFSPIFTTGKMKAMTAFMEKTAADLVTCISKSADAGEPFEAKEMLGKYSMDTIASCAFGVDAQSFANTSSLFVKYASNIFNGGGLARLFKVLLFFMPGGFKLMRMLGMSFQLVTETDFFYNAVVSSLKHRRETKTRRNDLVDLMMDAIKGEIDVDDKDESGEQFEKDAKLNHKGKREFDELVIVATAIVFMVAGYDTTGTTLAYACYQLAKHPEVQEKLRLEVDAVLEDPSKKLSYDEVQGMTYMEQVISETLRLHNPASLMTRNVGRDYKLPGYDLELKKDTAIWVNAVALHSDPAVYPNPKEFNPDNFSKENKAKRSPYSFMAFGQGPRGCVGMRFALLEAKVALAEIIRNFTLSPSEKTEEPLVLDLMKAIAYPKGGLHVKAERRSI